MKVPLQIVRPLTLFALFLTLTVVTVLPLSTVYLPPILDYPNHMARMHILAALAASADLARYYIIHWSPIPDLAADVIVPILIQAMTVETAMRIFLGAILIGLAGGCVVLHRTVFGKWSLWPLSIFLLLYNRMLLWGFINYLAGLALTLWGLALWIALERKLPILRILAGAVIAIVIYLAHLAAFGCYAIAIVAYSLAPRDGEHFKFDRAIVAAISLLPPVILFLLSATSGALASIAFGNPFRKFDLPVSIFDNYSRIFDGATFGVLLIALIWSLARGGLIAHRRLRWSVLAVGAAFVLMPSQFLSASGIDHRLPIAIAVIAVAATDWTGLSETRQRWVGGLLLLLFLVRMSVIGTVWVKADHEYGTLIPAFDLIDKGAAVAVAAPTQAVQAGGVPLLHFPTLAVIRRDAFIPSLFADPLQQPVHFTAMAAGLAAEASPARLWDDIDNGISLNLAGYDDLIIIDPPGSLDPSRLPGTILFKAPRLILIHLTQPSGQPVQ